MLILWHFIVHWLGADYGSSYGDFQPYDFLSGVAGLSLVGILYQNVRKHNCEVHGCWRVGRHKTAAGHVVCRRHHPDDKLTPSMVREASDAVCESSPSQHL